MIVYYKHASFVALITMLFVNGTICQINEIYQRVLNIMDE